MCPPDCYLNSNTSSLLMSDIYARVSDHRKTLTFSVDHDDPIRNNYLEMMWNPSTSEETKKAAMAHYHTLGFEPVVTEHEIKGYSINRVWRAVKRECLYLWANGYTDPAEFDRGWMIEWNTNIGPFKLMDLIGLETIYNIENSYYAASGDERDKPPAKLKEMIDAGHLGMKSGSGFYSGYDTEAGNLPSITNKKEGAFIMELTAYQQEMLDGVWGKGKSMAMQVLVGIGKCFDAPVWYPSPGPTCPSALRRPTCGSPASCWRRVPAARSRPPSIRATPWTTSAGRSVKRLWKICARWTGPTDS